jgi:hypothetical protein
MSLLLWIALAIVSGVALGALVGWRLGYDAGRVAGLPVRSPDGILRGGTAYSPPPPPSNAPRRPAPISPPPPSKQGHPTIRVEVVNLPAVFRPGDES